MKKALCIVMALSMLLAWPSAAMAAQPTPDVSIMVTGLLDLSTLSAYVIDDTVYCKLFCTSSHAATYRIDAMCHLEKNVNGTWVKQVVDTGYKYWTEYENGKTMNETTSQVLTGGKGQYRVTIIYSVISGIGSQNATHTYIVNYT